MRRKAVEQVCITSYIWWCTWSCPIPLGALDVIKTSLFQCTWLDVIRTNFLNNQANRKIYIAKLSLHIEYTDPTLYDIKTIVYMNTITHV